MLDSVIKVNKKYYPQTLLEECKYKMKNDKMENLINDDFDSCLSDESDNESDNEFDNETVFYTLLNLYKLRIFFFTYYKNA